MPLELVAIYSVRDPREDDVSTVIPEGDPFPYWQRVKISAAGGVMAELAPKGAFAVNHFVTCTNREAAIKERDEKKAAQGSLI